MAATRTTKRRLATLTDPLAFPASAPGAHPRPPYASQTPRRPLILCPTPRVRASAASDEGTGIRCSSPQTHGGACSLALWKGGARYCIGVRAEISSETAGGRVERGSRWGSGVDECSTVSMVITQRSFAHGRVT